jgi:hypothetical protein
MKTVRLHIKKLFTKDCSRQKTGVYIELVKSKYVLEISG